MTGHDRDTVTSTTVQSTPDDVTVSLFVAEVMRLRQEVAELRSSVWWHRFTLIVGALLIVAAILASCGAGPEAPATPNPGYVGTPTPTPRSLPTSEAIAWPNHLSSPAVIDIVSSHRVSGVQYTRAEMVAILDAVDWPHETREAALQVAWCESRWRPDATGAVGEMSLWQIHPRWHADATYDPVGNARAALRISDGGRNWWAWTCKPW